MSEVLDPITFELELDEGKSDLIIPPEFIKDFYFRSDHHLMIMVRVVGRDATKVRDFFQDTEGESFRLKAVYNSQKVDDELLLTDMHMDEGPSLGVDIDQEQALVRLILDFKKI